MKLVGLIPLANAVRSDSVVFNTTLLSVLENEVISVSPEIEHTLHNVSVCLSPNLHSSIHSSDISGPLTFEAYPHLVGGHQVP